MFSSQPALTKRIYRRPAVKTLGTLIEKIWNAGYTLIIVLAIGAVAGGMIGYKASGSLWWTIGGIVIGFIGSFIVGIILEAAINGLDSPYYDD